MIGYAICGSFCTHKKALDSLQSLINSGYDIVPILSENTQTIDTRFGKASDFKANVELITGNKCITDINQAEPLGPTFVLDALIIAPCTGNTLAKMAHGITDTCVTMAAKAHLRNARPVVIGLCTNDGLSANLKNVGTMLNKKNVYFVPFYQDDYVNKPNSLVCNMDMVEHTLHSALIGKQLQPLLDIKN